MNVYPNAHLVLSYITGRTYYLQGLACYAEITPGAWLECWWVRYYQVVSEIMKSWKMSPVPRLEIISKSLTTLHVNGSTLLIVHPGSHWFFFFFAIITNKPKLPDVVVAQIKNSYNGWLQRFFALYKLIFVRLRYHGYGMRIKIITWWI